jgi:hypothetical protein
MPLILGTPSAGGHLHDSMKPAVCSLQSFLTVYNFTTSQSQNSHVF